MPIPATAMQRENSLHKIDTLLAALQKFRAALEEEARLYAEREQMLAARKRGKKEKRPKLHVIRA